MAKQKLRVGILFGGKSGEHEISLRSARSILAAIDRKKYDVIELAISRQGKWLTGAEAQKLVGSHPSANANPAKTAAPSAPHLAPEMWAFAQTRNSVYSHR